MVLAARGRRVRLTVRDDGQGFDPGAVSESSHGIQGMRERARILGGTLAITSRPGAGTTVSVGVRLAGVGE